MSSRLTSGYGRWLRCVLAGNRAGENRDTVEEFWDDAVLATLHKASEGALTTHFAERLARFLQTRQKIWLTQSGREGLRELLAILKTGGKSSVVICDYNCKSVVNAVSAAGFEVETFDVVDRSGRIEWEVIARQLDNRHAAVIVPHLFGVPTDFSPLVPRAAHLGICVIEDCAHTLGGTIRGRLAGTIGDAAIFSFNYDKPLSLGGGGALMVNRPELAARLSLREPAVPADKEWDELGAFRNYLSGRRRAIPGHCLPVRIWKRIARRAGLDDETPPVEASGIGPLRAALGIWQLNRYPEILQRRNANANLLRNLAGCTDWYVGPDVRPAWLRAKVIPRNPHHAPAIARRLQQGGLRVGCFNWSRTVQEHLGRPPHPNATYLARHSLDAPIHQKMTRDDLARIAEALRDE